MESCNIESGNAENLEARPLKKVKVEHMNDCDLSSSPWSPTSVASPSHNIESSNVDDTSDAEKVACSELYDKKILLDDDKQEEQHEQFTYDYLPQDYTMTDLDCCAQITIEASLGSDILVKMDDFFVRQAQLSCLLYPEKFLNDDVISGYICCMKDQAHLQSRNGLQFYFEHPLNSAVLKNPTAMRGISTIRGLPAVSV
ncbi:unnamed protein product [Urochloa decumbens]|uniref:Uncharacterized protein n=1 Tax=Urochloa decumbens TaxID=240449 RepID=A0ABC9D8T0_9POAL